MPSEAFEAFEASIRHPDPRLFIYDLDALARLPINEVPAAHAILDARIRAGDLRAIETALEAGYVGLTAALKGQLDSGSAPAREAAARALANLTGAPDVVARVIAALRTGPTDVRIQAAHELARTPTVAARGALREALADAEAIVRVHAWKGLLEQLDLEELAAVRHSPLGVLTVRLYTDLASVRTAAATEAGVIVERIEGGESPEDLALDGTDPGEPPEVARFVATLHADQPEIDLASMQALDPPHRAWADAVLVAALVPGDVRAARALVDLGATWAIPALLDAAARADDVAFADVATAAARRLRAP